MLSKIYISSRYHREPTGLQSYSECLHNEAQSSKGASHLTPSILYGFRVLQLFSFACREKQRHPTWQCSADDISVLDTDDADAADAAEDADGAKDADDADPAEDADDADGAVGDPDDADTVLGAEGSVDWICQFCPSFLCINCA